MELRSFSLERYKGYAELATVDLAPLTIFVGQNNSGKTALAQGLTLLAGGLAPGDRDAREPLPLEASGIQHAQAFEDLVTGRPVHGRLGLAAVFQDDQHTCSLSTTVRNVVTPGLASERQISRWQFLYDDRTVVADRTDFTSSSDYRISVLGDSSENRFVSWRGLLPSNPEVLADWVSPPVDALVSWAGRIRHLRCPRRLLSSPFLPTERASTHIGTDGRHTPLVLAADEELLEVVRRWYDRTFGVRIELRPQGRYLELVTGTSFTGCDVSIQQAGRGLAHVLPVAVTALLARRAGPGIDIIEHPEAELHPAAHANIAELLLENLSGPTRPLIVETHSEMILLRTRRWIAEGRLPAADVLVYWIHTEPSRGSLVRRIAIRPNGQMETWPDGVFIESYEETIAIRRASRNRIEN